MSRTKLIKEALDEGYNLIIVERSIYTDRNVFASALYDSNKLKPEHLYYIDAIGMSWDTMKENYLKEVGR